MSENSLEIRKEEMSAALENFLNYSVEKNAEGKPTDTFLKVVESLKSKGVFLPNNKIINISTVYTSSGNYFYVCKFSNKITLLFDRETENVTAKIEYQIHNLNSIESKEYRDRYFVYIKLFLDEKSRMFDNVSASIKLSEFGI